MHDDFRIDCFLNKNVVEIQLNINDIKISPDLAVNLFALAKSCQIDGEFYFFTCECGDPSCAGIRDGVTVIHSPNKITWSLQVEALEQQLEFDQVSYQNAVDQTILQLKALYKKHQYSIQLPIYGQRWEDLMVLDTQVFSDRQALPARRLVAKHVVIPTYGNDFFINGMHYNIDELSLPKKLVDQYKTWMQHAKDEYKQADAVDYRMLLVEGNLFISDLQQYLGKDCILEFRPPRLNGHSPDALVKLFES